MASADNQQLLMWCLAARPWWGLQSDELSDTDFTLELQGVLAQTWIQGFHKIGCTGAQTPERLPLGDQWETFMLCVLAGAHSSVPENLEFAQESADVLGHFLASWIGPSALLSARVPFLATSIEIESNTTTSTTAASGSTRSSHESW